MVGVCSLLESLRAESLVGKMALNTSNAYCTPWNTLVLTDPGAASGLLYSQVENIVYLTSILVIFVIGALANFAFLFMVARLSRMQTTVNLYLANLAVADFVFLFVSTVYYVATLLHSPVTENLPFHGKASCVLMFAPAMVSYYASLGIVTLMSLERFLAICHPLKHAYVKGKRRAVRMITGLWIVSIAPASVQTLQNANNTKLCVKWPTNNEFYENMPKQIHVCLSLIPGSTFTGIAAPTFFVATFVLPMLVNIVMYARIIVAVSITSRSAAVTDQRAGSNLTLVRNQVTRILVITGVIFFALQIPLRLLSVDRVFRNLAGLSFLDNDQRRGLLISGRFLVLINSATNSLIYAFISAHYRKGFIEAFSCRKAGKHGGIQLDTLSSRIVK